MNNPTLEGEIKDLVNHPLHEMAPRLDALQTKYKPTDENDTAVIKSLRERATALHDDALGLRVKIAAPTGS